MSKLIMMVGLPASGKTTLAEKLAEKENAVIVSSDAMREELFGDVDNQDNNTRLFEEVGKRIKTLLGKDETVVFDATNINRKRRIHFINNEIKADEKVVYYMNTSLSWCLQRDSRRERHVGAGIIDKMYRNMHIPTKSEGWDEVVFVEGDSMGDWYKNLFEKCVFDDSFTNSHSALFASLKCVVSEFADIYDMPQDSTYHSFSISRHTYYVFKYIKDNFERYEGERHTELLVAALFHDLGKAHCKSFFNYKGEEKRYANYIGHENVSSQIACESLMKLGYNDNFVKYVVDLIQFHMMPMNMSEKVEKRLRGLITEEQYNDLMLLHEADLSAK